MYSSEIKKKFLISDEYIYAVIFSRINSKGVKTALKNLFPLWNNGKKKVNEINMN